MYTLPKLLCRIIMEIINGPMFGVWLILNSVTIAADKNKCAFLMAIHK